MKKGKLFVWTSEQESSFQTLKTALVTAPVLALPNLQNPLLIETDASNKGIGAVIQQDGHPMAYVSKALGPKNQALSTYEKECLAILLAVEHWRQYLQHQEFMLKTDQKSLAYLDEQRLTTPWQHKALIKLMGPRFKICYKQGKDNRAADALSRIPSGPHQEILAISSLQSTWLKELVDTYSSHAPTVKILSSLAVHSPSGHLSLEEGVIKYKGKVWVGHDASMQLKILQSLHSSPVGGHSGFSVTYKRIKELFAWPDMKKMIKQFVAQCTICQQAKPERVKYPGFLQPLHVPKYAWQVPSLDFIEGLPTSEHFNCILVVVDKFF